MRIGIVGGGASGIMCAINAKTDDNEVVILERNNECCKKILATGNGKCNYWNSNQELDNYESSTTYRIDDIINTKTELEVLDFFKSIGIIPKIKNGYYYPNSNQALTIKEILIEEALDRGVIIKNNYLVQKIENDRENFIINGKDKFDIIVLATGSCASPKTGSDGMGYKFLKDFDHKLVKPLPALVQLVTKKYSYLNYWKGIRSDAKVSLYENGVLIEEETGEIQLADYGISGICVFNISNRAARGLDSDCEISVDIDFLPNIDENELYDLLCSNRTINRILKSLLNNKLVNIILELNKIDENTRYNELSNTKKNMLLDTIKRFKVEIIATKSFEEAQVASGGVLLEELEPFTLESKMMRKMYVIGELLDLTGKCGGYNLGIAWRSAIMVADDIRGRK